MITSTSVGDEFVCLSFPDDIIAVASIELYRIKVIVYISGDLRVGECIGIHFTAPPTPVRVDIYQELFRVGGRSFGRFFPAKPLDPALTRDRRSPYHQTGDDQGIYNYTPH
jgi:hypothetical protein